MIVKINIQNININRMHYIEYMANFVLKVTANYVVIVKNVHILDKNFFPKNR